MKFDDAVPNLWDYLYDNLPNCFKKHLGITLTNKEYTSDEIYYIVDTIFNILCDEPDDNIGELIISLYSNIQFISLDDSDISDCFDDYGNLDYMEVEALYNYDIYVLGSFRDSLLVLDRDII